MRKTDADSFIASWIPVTQSLPEGHTNPVTQDYYEYICTVHIGNVDTVRCLKFGKGHWWNWGEVYDDYVVAWQPLPDPFKPYEKENKE